MARQKGVSLQLFNRGRISRLALARTDIDRLRVSASKFTNWMPRSLGSMMFRPGLGYVGGILNDNACRLMPFVFNATDTAIIEQSSGAMRVWVDDTVVQRSQSTSAFSNGDFSSSNLTGWTDADESGSTSYWVSGSKLGLVGTRYAYARRRQTVTATETDMGISVHVSRGKPLIKIGSSSAGDDYLGETQLRPGRYSFKVTTTGDMYCELFANTEYVSIVDEVAVESQGDMSVPSTFVEGDLANMRWDQSNDVVFFTAGGVQKRIERYSTESWALVDYQTEDGPFRTINITSKRLTPSALTGNVTLSCDQPLFESGNAGSLFEITSIGQKVSASFTSGDQTSDSIRVTGVDDSRKFQILVTDAGSADPLYIQRSIGEEGAWTDITALQFTSTTDSTHDDSLDNQIVFYRMSTPSTFSGTAAGELNYSGGGIVGRCRIDSVISATESSASVLKAFGSTSGSELWAEGSWSEKRGFPSAVGLHEGRLFWVGKSNVWGSVSDAYESFDADVEGDSAPIQKVIGTGSNDIIRWILSLTRLVVGTPLQELQAKTSSLEEPLTPTNFALRDISTQGSANVQAVKIDQRALFVQAGGTRLMEIGLTQGQLDFETLDRSIIIPEIGEPAITRLVAQRQPDTRIHCVRSDGTVAVFLTDPAEQVLCWFDVETDGNVEEAVVLPGAIEDSVYYVVSREIDGSTKRYLEKWALESEARGLAETKLTDSHIVVNTTGSTEVTGLTHLIGESVSVWGATDDLGMYTVSTSGTITTLSKASTTAVVGLPYYGTWQSVKLSGVQDGGYGLVSRQRINHVGVLLADTHARGLQYGNSTNRMQYLPAMEKSQKVSTDAVHSAYDEDPLIFPGSWNTDERLVLFAESPKPCTVLAAIIDLKEN